jgi:hypothetical protein
MSEVEVRRLDGDRLHPRKAGDGSYLYAPEEVVGLLRRLLRADEPRHDGDVGAVSADGEIASAAFSRFEMGQGAARIVTDLKVNPLLAQDLRRTYDAMTGELAVSAKVRTELERLVGKPIKNGDELLSLLARLAGFRRPVVAEPASAEDEGFGTVVDAATGQPRSLSREESANGVTSLVDKWSATTGARPGQASVPPVGSGGSDSA